MPIIHILFPIFSFLQANNSVLSPRVDILHTPLGFLRYAELFAKRSQHFIDCVCLFFVPEAQPYSSPSWNILRRVNFSYAIRRRYAGRFPQFHFSSPFFSKKLRGFGCLASVYPTIRKGPADQQRLPSRRWLCSAGKLAGDGRCGVVRTLSITSSSCAHCCQVGWRAFPQP